jgi:excisionase family DNA binding protein
MPDSFLTVSEVADLLRLNPQTVRQWIDKGKLPAVRLGERQVRIRQSDLEQFIDAGTNSPASRASASASAMTHELPTPDLLLTKQQIAQHLGRSPRWIDTRVKAGMPSEPPTSRFPHRRFRVSQVEAWLSAGEKEAHSHDERLARLEEQLARLSATVEELQQKLPQEASTS